MDEITQNETPHDLNSLIDEAIAAHKEWRHILLHDINDGKELGVRHIRSVENCKLGKLLASDAFTQEVKDSRVMQQIHSLHNLFHMFSADLVETKASSGKILSDFKNRFDMISSLLIDELETLKHKPEED